MVVHCACWVGEATEDQTVSVPNGNYAVRVCRFDQADPKAPDFVIDLWPATAEDRADYRWQWLD